MTDTIKQTTTERGVTLSFDESLYPKPVVLGAAYTFLDQCYVHLDRVDGRIIVSLRPKAGQEDRWDRDAAAGTFESEALSQAWRRELMRENADLIEKVTGRVLAGAAGPASLDDLLAEELGDVGDAFDDPLGIAVSWEEKYGKGSVEEQADHSESQDSSGGDGADDDEEAGG